ncbi:MAG: hypothetical protein ACR2QC_00030 [Gammaproteobacteria bacterium]
MKSVMDIQKAKDVFLPRSREELEAMSAAEIDAAIAELRRRQKRSRPAPVRLSVWGDAFGGGFGGGGNSYRIPSVQEGWAEDARNLRGDWEKVGRDMWIGMLQHAKSENSA